MLKRRRTLVSGLVGGPALLREWEEDWKERFEGEERDELRADEIANNDAKDEGSEKMKTASWKKVQARKVGIAGCCQKGQEISSGSSANDQEHYHIRSTCKEDQPSSGR